MDARNAPGRRGRRHRSSTYDPSERDDQDAWENLDDYVCASDPEEDDFTVPIHVFRRFWWFLAPELTEAQQRAQMKKPAALRSEPAKVWKMRESDAHDRRPQHIFRMSPCYDTRDFFRARAEEILVLQFPNALDYMINSRPSKRTTLYACIMSMTQKKNPPQEPRIKKRYNIDDDNDWTSYLDELNVLRSPNWAAALFEMEHPEATLSPQQKAFDEQAAYAAWQTKQQHNALGVRPSAVVPNVADPNLLSGLARALKD